MRRIILCLFLLLFLSPVAYASDYTGHKQNSDLEVVISSNNASSCNVTYIQYPDNSKTIMNLQLTKSATTFYRTIISGNFTQLGVTCLGIECTNGITTETGSVCKEVTYTGDKITTEQSYIYIIALIFLVLLALSLVFISNKLPLNDSMDEEGTILQVSQMKHLRPVLWICVWAIGLACLFIISNLGIAFLPNLMIGKLFFVIYQIFFYVTIIGVPVSFILIFVKIFKDKETQKLIERGVDIRGTP